MVVIASAIPAAMTFYSGEQEMSQFVNRIRRFLASEDGPTATEYAVMLALIIIVALGAITALGTKVSTTFSNVTTALPTG